jgi:putative tricarboxylic transport membrane protein
MNKPGAGGSLAWNYMAQHAGDAHYLAVSSPTLLTNHIVGQSTHSHLDFEAVANLFNDHIAIAVRPDSKIQSARDLVEQLRNDPTSVRIALATALGNQNHIGIALPLRAAGIDIRKLRVAVFPSSSAATTALLGGHVDLVPAGLSSVVKLLDSGKVRAIAISSAKRMAGPFATVPTWQEQGVPAVFSTFRGIVAPRGITHAQIAFWESAMLRVSESEDWRKHVAQNNWAHAFLGARETSRLLRTQYDELRAVLRELGMAR